MKRISKRIRLMGALLAVAVMCMPSMKVEAGVENYTVTFRPGNVGSFAFSGDAAGSKQENAEAVATQQYAGIYGADNVTVTKNGAIKVTVPAGAAMPQAPVYIEAESGYFVKDTSIWGPTTQTVDKNMDFVVDYGKLVNGVEYTVEYVDEESGESIAPVYIAQANIGESRIETAPAQIVISEGTVYNLTSDATIEMVLDSDSANNIFTFSYTMAPRGTVVEEVVNYVDGGVITTTETVTTVIDNGTTVIPANTPAQGGGGAATPEAEPEVEVENIPENVVIEEEQTPLAPAAPEGEQNAENEGNMVVIGEDEVPLADFAGEEPTGNTLPIWAGVFVAAAAAVTVLWIFMKKKKSTNE